jgi:tRNA-binding EMAP/Myf-like protein
MKKILLILTLLSVTVFANVGKITAIKGDVVIKRDTKEIVAKVGSILELKDSVISKGSSRAMILFNDKTTITVGKNSNLAVEEFVQDEKVVANNKATFKFGNGVFRTITGKIGKLNKEKFKIKTSTASIGIRGTVFLVEAKVDSLRIGVEDGGVFMSPLDQNIQPQEIPKGKVLTYDDNTKEFTVMPISEWKAVKQEQEESLKMEKEIQKSDKKAVSVEDNKKQEKTPNDTPPAPVDDFKDVKLTPLEPSFQNFNPDFASPLEDLKKVVDDANDKAKNTNTAPSLSVSDLKIDEDSSGVLTISASDIDGDTLKYTISTPTNGTAILNGHTITYIPNSDFYGTDTIKVTVTDGNGGVVSKTITITVVNIPEIITGDIDTITEEIAEITGELLPQDNLDHLDYGFIVETAGDIATAYDTYISGTITPDTVIQNYISQGVQANYKGAISALVDGATSSGAINLDVDFGKQLVTGKLSVTQGNWAATINSGTVNPTGFNSTDITGTSDLGTITSGTMNGKFYGTTAQNIGGTIKLNTSTSSANGVFGASK